jgi:hypothetical protein
LGSVATVSANAQQPAQVAARWRRYAVLGIALICCALALKQRGRIFVDSSGWLPPSRPLPTFEPGTVIPIMGSYPSLLQPTDYLARNFDALLPSVPDGSRALVRPALVFYAGLRGVRLRRSETIQGLVDSLEPGDHVLIDAAQIDQTGDRDTQTALYRKVQRGVAQGGYVLPPATLLDLDPRAARGDEQMRAGVKQLWVGIAQ